MERIRIQDTEDRREIGGGGRMGIWRGQEVTDLRASMLLMSTSTRGAHLDHNIQLSQFSKEQHLAQNRAA